MSEKQNRKQHLRVIQLNDDGSIPGVVELVDQGTEHPTTIGRVKKLMVEKRLEGNFAIVDVKMKGECELETLLNTKFRRDMDDD